MRQISKTLLERLLAGRPSLALAGALRPVSGAIFAYHNVVEGHTNACGDRSLHLGLDQFIQQIDWLERQFEVVSLADAFERREGEKPFAVITFDDAYRGALRLALPELLARDLPATVFVCSAWQDGAPPWWDVLANANGLAETVRATALVECRGRNDAVLEWARERGLAMSTLPPDYCLASSREIEATVEGSRISVGAHTRTHPNLCRLPDDQLEIELRRSLVEIRDRFREFAIPWLAYPYGLADRRVRTAAREAGYAGALRVKGGPIRSLSNLDAFAVPRVYVPRGVTLRNLRLRAAGLF